MRTYKDYLKGWAHWKKIELVTAATDMKISDAEFDEQMHFVEDIEMLIKENELYTTTLNEIASWDEGKKVNSGFDCPHFSKLARKALKE